MDISEVGWGDDHNRIRFRNRLTEAQQEAEIDWANNRLGGPVEQAPGA
jgi:hypothetical protein